MLQLKSSPEVCCNKVFVFLFLTELTSFVGDELWHLTAGSPRELNRLCSAL